MRTQDPALHLTGNEHILLGSREICCTVQYGTLALFAVYQSEERTSRHFLWEVKTGELLVWTGTPVDGPYQIVVIALEPVQLASVSLADDDRAADLVDGWVRQVQAALSKVVPDTPPELFQTAVWPQTNLIERLKGVESALSAALPQLDAITREKQQADVFRRTERDSAILEESVSDLTSILGAPKTSRHDSNAIADVFYAVARSAYITIPPGTSASSRNCASIEDFADRVGIRLRKVKLSGRWWEKDNGPLIGFDEASGQPRAILPAPRGLSRIRYEVFDPANGGITAVLTPVLASKLSASAFTLYRPMPDPPRLGALINFAMAGLSRDMIIVACCGIGTVLLGMAVPQATAVLVESAIPEGNSRLVYTVAAVLSGAAVGALLFGFAESLTLLRVETKWGTTFQAAVWDRLLRLSPSFFRRYTAGDLQARANAISAIRSQLSGTTLYAVVLGIASLLNLALMFYYSAVLALAGVAIAAVTFVVYLSWARFIARVTPKLEEIEGRLFGAGVQLIDAVPKLRIAGAEGRAFAYWSRIYAQKQKLRYEVSRIEDRVAVFNGALPILSLAAVFGVAMSAAPPVNTVSALNLGSFLAFNAAFGAFLAGMTALTSNGVRLLNVAALWKRVEPILDEPPEIRAGDNQFIQLSGRVTVNHVTFRYRDDGPLTLEDVSLDIEAGSCVALVGPSGSGKTTVISLLLGFESPRSGAIYFDGYDLTNLDVRTVRRQIGVVLQHNGVMAGSIFENIVSGTSCTMSEAWDAARAAAFDTDINQFPMRMHTVVSEGGRNLSGGQRQRLALARALVLKPRILILDEATSALDNTTQAIVMENLDRLRVTRIIVAHRLSTIKQADRIYVVDAGRIVQSGTFEELTATEGLFQKLIHRQTI